MTEKDLEETMKKLQDKLTQDEEVWGIIITNNSRGGRSKLKKKGWRRIMTNWKESWTLAIKVGRRAKTGLSETGRIMEICENSGNEEEEDANSYRTNRASGGTRLGETERRMGQSEEDRFLKRNEMDGETRQSKWDVHWEGRREISTNSRN